MIVNLWRIETPESRSLRMTARSKKAAHPKDNAKGRRKKENKELSDLASQLPLPFNVATQLDKASVIRLATSYLKLRRLFPHGLGKEWGEDSSVAEDVLPEMGKFLNKAFHGFVFVLGADATILYISEEASAQLGFSQVQLTGKCFWSCIHSHDAKELKTILCFDRDVPAFNVGNQVADDIEVPRSFSARMKCILPKRQAELAVDRYKVIHCRGYLKLKQKSKHWDGLSSICYEMTGVVASGYSLSPTPSAEIKLYRRDFMFRTGLNLQFSYVDPRSQKITGYEPTQLQEKSLYKFIHPYDCRQMKQVHEMVLTKSQAVSSYYRFLTRNGGWIWIQSSCIVITSNKTDHGQCILFINSILSEREYPNCILAIEQVESTHESKQCNPSKRSRTSLKSRKRPASHIPEDSSPNQQNSTNASSNETPDIQGLIDMPLSGSTNNQQLNHIPGFIQRSHLYESLHITNSLEFNNAKYAPLSDLINASGLNRHASPPHLDPVNNAINFRHGINAEFYASPNAIQNLCPELDDSGIAFQNLIMESSPLQAMINATSTNEQVTHYTTLMSVKNSDSENYEFLNPCVSATPLKDNLIFKANHRNLTNSLLAFNNFNNPSQKSSLDFSICDDNSDRKLHVSNSVSVLDKNSVSTTEGDDKFAVNSCNSSSPQNNKIDCVNESDITTSDSIKNFNISLDANQHTHSADGIRYSKNSHEDSYMRETLEQNQTRDHENCNVSKRFADSLPEKMHSNFSTTAYNFSNTQSNEALSGIAMNENKYTSQFDLFSNAISRKKMSDEENDLLLTPCANVTKHDYDQCFNKSPDLNNKTISDNEWMPVVLPTVDQSIIRNDDDNIFYVLNDLNTGTISYSNYTTTEISTFPVTMEDDNIMSHINHIPSPVETAVPSIAFSDCNNELGSLNIDTNPQVLNQSSGISSSITNIDQSGISSTSHNLNNSSSSNVVRTTTKDSPHEDITIGSEYLSLLNDQWVAMYSQSATNARSDSASSVSLGYGSESSYLGQSSPFSTYGESSYL